MNFTAVTQRPSGAMQQADQAAHRPVGHVRRLDAVRLDALAARAVRVRLRARVPADARCRQSEGEVRRDHLPRRRHSRERDGGGGGFGGGGSRRPDELPGGISRSSRPRHHRQDRAAAEEVRRRRRRDRRLRRLRGARSSSRLADRRSPRRDDEHRRRARAAARQVLHPGIDPEGRGRQHQPARLRLREAGRRDVRQQPGDAPRARARR